MIWRGGHVLKGRYNVKLALGVEYMTHWICGIYVGYGILEMHDFQVEDDNRRLKKILLSVINVNPSRPFFCYSKANQDSPWAIPSWKVSERFFFLLELWDLALILPCSLSYTRNGCKTKIEWCHISGSVGSSIQEFMD